MRPSSSSSSRRSVENNRAITGKMGDAHTRLYNAFKLALNSNRCNDDMGRKWQFTDIEIQKLVIRSMDAFLDCITPETLEHPLMKNSLADMAEAMGSILELQNEVVLSLASRLAPKMVIILLKRPSNVLDLVRPLSSVLPSHHVQVSVSCGAALNLILTNLSIRNEDEVWKILVERNTVGSIISNIRGFSTGDKPIQYFQEMSSLLSKILRRWPPSRFSVWNDPKLMEVLKGTTLKADYPSKVAVLQLYSALALCSNGAQKLLEDGEVLINMIVHCMDSSNSPPVQIEAFKLAQCLSMNEQGCLQMMKICCEPIIKAIIRVLSNLPSHPGKVTKDQVSLSIEVCRLALITRWPGEHHNCLWRLGIDNVLVNLLPNNVPKYSQEDVLDKFFSVLVPFIWDILGWLSAHCGEDFMPMTDRNKDCIKILMTQACTAFVDSMDNPPHLQMTDTANACMSEPASRSVLLMVYSPSKYIASQVRSILDPLLQVDNVKCKKHLTYLLDNLSVMPSGIKFGLPDKLQSVIDLMNLACYSALARYRTHVIKCQGIKKLLAIIKWCLHNHVHVRRSTVVPHLRNTSRERTSCCWDYAEYWEDEDMLLLFGLWGLAELIHHSGGVKSQPDMFAGQMGLNKNQLISELQEVYMDVSTPGARWFAAYILSYFGFYGYSSKFGKRIGKTLHEKEYADLEFILKSEESVSVHRVILQVRCPSFLPSQYKSERSGKEVHPSARVDCQALSKFLEFIYTGYLQAGVDIVKKLKTFAKHFKLQFLLQMLCGVSPKWGTPFPRFDLTSALGPAGHQFSDIILEAKATEVMDWTCRVCSLTLPHMHAHKVILLSSCDYLRALFESGMQESHSETIKVPVSWEALVKLCNWFYSGELPMPVSGCLWSNLNSEEKLREVQSYVELFWLAGYWLLDDIGEDCSRVIISCLDSARPLSFRIIQIADRLSLYELVDVAANYLGPLYPRLRDSGALEELDEPLIDKVREAFVRLSQEGDRHPYRYGMA